MRFSFTCGIIGSQLSGQAQPGSSHWFCAYAAAPTAAAVRRMARGKDFAVGGFWLVALFIFIAGQQQRLYLPERNKHKADPLFYTGIVLIAVATPV